MKKFFSKKIELSLPWRLLLWLALSGMILLVCVALQAGSLRNTLGNFLRKPQLILLNLFPVLALVGLLSLLFGNVFWAGSLSSLLFELLSLANLIKIESRKDPLVPPDFALLGEAMVATGEYQLDLHIPYLIFILLLALALLLLGFRFRGRGKPWQRIAGALALLGLFIGSMCTVYPSPDVYRQMIDSVEGLTISNVPAVFDETGFLYCFLHNYRLYDVQKPEGYDEDEARTWAAAPGQAAGLLPVDLIFVQCEAFSDLYDAEAFDYDPADSPMTLYHQTADSPQAISGRLVVSNYGAGTANTEFDILTGIQTNMLNENSTSALRVVHKNMSSLARSFARLGYAAWFMHPGESWFYNRDSVYDYFGFRERSFLEAFQGEYRWKGGYISDEGFARRLIERYEAQKAASDAPWFAFTVTIQNHQAYPWGKYAERPPLAPLKQPVSEETLETLSVYAEGIRDSSRMLAELAAYFDRREEPMLLIFWGDHLPALGKSFSVYRELGLDIGNEADLGAALDTYSTPFLIRANSAFCRQYDFAARTQALELPAGERISDIYLGELIYELCGMEGSDPYFDFLGRLRRSLPVICQGRYELPDGTGTETLTQEQRQLVDKLRKWGYYRVIDERVVQ